MSSKGFGFLFEMGCGKSLTAIATIGALYQEGKIKRVLVVAPSSVVGVWPRELAQFADFPFICKEIVGNESKRVKALGELHSKSFMSMVPEAPGLRVAVINYESVWRDKIYDAICQYAPDMIICDESQRIKSHTAKQSKAMHRLGDITAYKLILSGTPVQNSAMDLFSQFRFLNKDVFGSYFFPFRSRYAIMGGFQDHQIVGYKNMDELVRKEASCSYRVTKEECLDLPEKTFENRYIDLPPSVERTYKQIKRDSYAELASGGSVTAQNVLTRLLRLQQLTGGFIQEDGSDRSKLVHTAKLDVLMDIVDDLKAEGKKLVVFCKFIDEIDAIASALSDKGIYYSVIDGRTPMEHKTERDTGREILSRSELVDDFQNHAKTTVMICQIQTAGLGITLHAASTAVFYSLDFNYANYEQATARIHRIGQKHPCTYIHLLVPGSVDEHIMDALSNKRNIADKVVDGWRELFDCDD